MNAKCVPTMRGLSANLQLYGAWLDGHKCQHVGFKRMVRCAVGLRHDESLERERLDPHVLGLTSGTDRCLLPKAMVKFLSNQAALNA